MSAGFVMAVVAASTLPVTSDDPLAEMIVGQFNMAGGNPDYGRQGDEAPDALAEAVRRRNPAFVTIQEACADWSARLDEQLDGYRVRFDPVGNRGGGGPARCQHGSTFGNAVLYRDDLAVDRTPEGYHLGSPARMEQREMLCVASTTRKIAVCSTHLSHGTSGMRPAARRSEAAVAARILATTYAGYTKIVGADLNDGPLSEPADSFYHPAYQHDARGEFKEATSPCGDQVKQGFTAYRPFPVFVWCRSGQSTYGSALTGTKVDHLFVPLTAAIRATAVTPTPHSDHSYVWAAIALGATSSV